jgi:hypothetical protein
LPRTFARQRVCCQSLSRSIYNAIGLIDALGTTGCTDCFRKCCPYAQFNPGYHTPVCQRIPLYGSANDDLSSNHNLCQFGTAKLCNDSTRCTQSVAAVVQMHPLFPGRTLATVYVHTKKIEHLRLPCDGAQQDRWRTGESSYRRENERVSVVSKRWSYGTSCGEGGNVGTVKHGRL